MIDCFFIYTTEENKKHSKIAEEAKLRKMKLHGWLDNGDFFVDEWQKEREKYMSTLKELYKCEMTLALFDYKIGKSSAQMLTAGSLLSEAYNAGKYIQIITSWIYQPLIVYAGQDAIFDSIESWINQQPLSI